VIDRHQQAVRFHQRGEDVLQDVFGIARVAHAPADEAAQPRPLPVHDAVDVVVVSRCHPLLV